MWVSTSECWPDVSKAVLQVLLHEFNTLYVFVYHSALFVAYIFILLYMCVKKKITVVRESLLDSFSFFFCHYIVFQGHKTFYDVLENISMSTVWKVCLIGFEQIFSPPPPLGTLRFISRFDDFRRETFKRIDWPTRHISVTVRLHTFTEQALDSSTGPHLKQFFTLSEPITLKKNNNVPLTRTSPEKLKKLYVFIMEKYWEFLDCQ